MKHECTEAVFLKDVATHQMAIIRDDGVYRHVRFGRPGSYCMRFDLVTWPGYLAYSGDMGCFVFQRLDDMFEFFRGAPRDHVGLFINPSYWGQKLEAVSRHGGFKEFSESMLRDAIEQRLKDAEASADLREAVEEEVLSKIDDGEHAVCQAVYYFEHEGFRFQDFFEQSLHDYTFHFIWCCYALAWGIKQYDAAKLDGSETEVALK